MTIEHLELFAQAWHVLSLMRFWQGYMSYGSPEGSLYDFILLMGTGTSIAPQGDTLFRHGRMGMHHAQVLTQIGCDGGAVRRASDKLNAMKQEGARLPGLASTGNTAQQQEVEDALVIIEGAVREFAVPLFPLLFRDGGRKILAMPPGPHVAWRFDEWVARFQGAYADIAERVEDARNTLLEQATGTREPRRGKDRQEPAEPLQGQTAVVEEKARGDQRVWTQLHCPSCGRAPIEFISKTEFARRAKGRGTTRRTVGRKVKDGIYWHDKSGNIPWCERCKEKTPEGPGVERQVDGPQEGSREPSDDEKRDSLLWAARIVEDELRLPFAEPDLSPSEDDPREQTAFELRDEGATAILRVAEQRESPLSRDEAEVVARKAIKKLYAEDYRSRMHGSQGDMIHPLSHPDNE